MGRPAKFCIKCKVRVENDGWDKPQICATCNKNNQNQLPNFRDNDGRFYLFKCYICNKWRWQTGVVPDECPVCKWSDPERRLPDA